MQCVLYVTKSEAFVFRQVHHLQLVNPSFEELV